MGAVTINQVRDSAPDMHTLAVTLADIVRDAMQDPAFMADYQEYLRREEEMK